MVVFTITVTRQELAHEIDFKIYSLDLTLTSIFGTIDQICYKIRYTANKELKFNVTR